MIAHAVMRNESQEIELNIAFVPAILQAGLISKARCGGLKSSIHNSVRIRINFFYDGVDR